MSEQQAGDSHTCAAFGCPLPGAFRGFGLGEGWWCFIHAAGSCDLQPTTQRVNANASAIRTVLRASNLGAHQWADAGNQRYIADALSRYGFGELIPTAAERDGLAKAWAYRARAGLLEACYVRQRDDLAAVAESPMASNEPKSLKEFFSGLHPADAA